VIPGRITGGSKRFALTEMVAALKTDAKGDVYPCCGTVTGARFRHPEVNMRLQKSSAYIPAARCDRLCVLVCCLSSVLNTIIAKAPPHGSDSIQGEM
jgi:hypothetical protein